MSDVLIVDKLLKMRILQGMRKNYLYMRQIVTTLSYIEIVDKLGSL